MIRRWCCLVGLATGMLLIPVPAAVAVETGPVARQWGLGWDDGLTARFWLKGVWELALAAGPSDFLRDTEGWSYDTGSPPVWDEEEIRSTAEDRAESGFVRLQTGRLVGRRGPLAAVGFLGLEYSWSDARYVDTRVDLTDPGQSYRESRDVDRSAWILTLGLRPSYEVLGFLTIETAFGLEYRWLGSDTSYRKEYLESGQVVLDTIAESGSSFEDPGWTGMGSLQFIVWF